MGNAPAHSHASLTSVFLRVARRELAARGAVPTLCFFSALARLPFLDNKQARLFSNTSGTLDPGNVSDARHELAFRFYSVVLRREFYEKSIRRRTSAPIDGCR